MHLTGGVLLALVAIVVSAPSGGKRLSISLNVHKKYNNLDQFREHLSSLQLHKGEIPLKAFLGVFYYAEIEMGIPGQKMNILFDTSTYDLLLTSYKICKKQKEFCKHHKVYNEHKSITYKEVGTKWSSGEGWFGGSGYTSNDTLLVGRIQVKNQMFGEATEVFMPVPAIFDGALGLAFSSIRKINSNSVFANMIEQKVVDQPLFAFKLNQYDEKKKTAAELVLGGVNPDHYTGEITYTPVTKQSFWFINIQGLFIGSEKIVGEYPATVEVSCDMLYGPSKFTDKINKALGGEKQWDGYYKVDCNKVSSFPDVTFTISGRSFVLTPTDYTFKWKPDKKIVCYSQFYGVDDLKHFFLGNGFISKFYTVYDVGQNRVGFATAK